MIITDDNHGGFTANVQVLFAATAKVTVRRHRRQWPDPQSK